MSDFDKARARRAESRRIYMEAVEREAARRAATIKAKRHASREKGSCNLAPASWRHASTGSVVQRPKPRTTGRHNAA